MYSLPKQKESNKLLFKKASFGLVLRRQAFLGCGTGKEPGPQLLIASEGLNGHMTTSIYSQFDQHSPSWFGWTSS